MSAMANPGPQSVHPGMFYILMRQLRVDPACPFSPYKRMQWLQNRKNSKCIISRGRP
jgi:hypothetical protein